MDRIDSKQGQHLSPLSSRRTSLHRHRADALSCKERARSARATRRRGVQGAMLKGSPCLLPPLHPSHAFIGENPHARAGRIWGGDGPAGQSLSGCRGGEAGWASREGLFDDMKSRVRGREGGGAREGRNCGMRIERVKERAWRWGDVVYRGYGRKRNPSAALAID